MNNSIVTNAVTALLITISVSSCAVLKDMGDRARAANEARVAQYGNNTTPYKGFGKITCGGGENIYTVTLQPRSPDTMWLVVYEGQGYTGAVLGKEEIPFDPSTGTASDVAYGKRGHVNIKPIVLGDGSKAVQGIITDDNACSTKGEIRATAYHDPRYAGVD